MPPAARISDQTAHGGIVTVGFPTVLICNLPAARIGDLHTCPMVTGVVPHVGGPFITGSFTVLVGSMPQAKVGDMLVCVGPPDTLIMGAPTVQVGMAGAGGGGFGSAMAGMTALAGQPPAPAAAPDSATSEMQTDNSIVTRYGKQIVIEGPLRYQAMVVRALRSFLVKPQGQQWQAEQVTTGRHVRICPAIKFDKDVRLSSPNRDREGAGVFNGAGRDLIVPFDLPEAADIDGGEAIGRALCPAAQAVYPSVSSDSLAA
jgi:uncharacterized Zn-binding protein involved in type VI secretion